MLKKLAGYFFVSILSFAFFSLCFHAVANAEGSPGIFAPLLSQAKPIPPKPPLIAIAPSPTPTNTPTPTPTEAPTPTDTPTPTIQPTETPSPSPTASPSPTDIPTPSVSSATQPTGSDLDAWFTKYANDYHIDRELLRGIAACESGFNTNSNYQDLYIGMYQFGESAWVGARQRMGLDTNPDLRKNAEESIKTAAYKLSQGEKSAWPNCPR